MLIDWFTVGAQAVNFLILVWLLRRFLYQPILRAIDTREQRIAAELAGADGDLLVVGQSPTPALLDTWSSITDVRYALVDPSLPTMAHYIGPLIAIPILLTVAIFVLGFTVFTKLTPKFAESL